MSTRCGVSWEPKWAKVEQDSQGRVCNRCSNSPTEEKQHMQQRAADWISTVRRGEKITENKQEIFIYTHAELDLVFSPLLNTSWQVPAPL